MPTKQRELAINFNQIVNTLKSYGYQVYGPPSCCAPEPSCKFYLLTEKHPLDQTDPGVKAIYGNKKLVLRSRGDGGTKEMYDFGNRLRHIFTYES